MKYKHLKKYLLFLILFCSFNHLVYSQQGCGTSTLKIAKSYYDIGLFEDAVEKLEFCLNNNGFNKNQLERAYHRLVLCYIQLEDFPKAEENAIKLINMNPLFTPDVEDPKVFFEIIEKIKNGLTDNLIFSASQKRENIRKAPSQTYVVTRQMIDQNAYTTLEQILMDIPGFQVSHINGTITTKIDARGIGGKESDKTLFLINGIQINDFWSNQSKFSSQLPISNVKRIEVIYGPSSTIYGANAYASVVNIITYSHDDRKDLNVNANVSYGTENNYFADLNINGKTESFGADLTFRYYHDEFRDLSDFSEFTYDSTIYSNFDYNQSLSIYGNEAREFARKYPNLLNNKNLDVQKDESGQIISISPSQQGQAVAKNLDVSSLDTLINNRKPAYSNYIDQIYVEGKLYFNNILLGYRTWMSEQGFTNNGTSYSTSGIKNNNLWKPSQSTLYLQYKKSFNKKFTIYNSAYYQLSKVKDGTLNTTLQSYATSRLTLADLAMERPSYWNTTDLYQSSNQFRNKLLVQYQASDNFYLQGGVDYRNSIIQGDLLQTDSSNTVSKSSLKHNSNDIGIYITGQLEANEWAKIVAGIRWNYNVIDQKSGYGSLFNHKLGLVLTPKNFHLKLLTETGFQEPTMMERFKVSESIPINAPDLAPEKNINYELNFGYNDKSFEFDCSAFYNDLYDLVELNETSELQYQYQNTGKGTIKGVQSSVKYKVKKYNFYANYTYLDPKIQQNDSTDKVRIGGISNHVFNFGINSLYFNHLNINLRGNYLSKRTVGDGTSLPQNTKGEFPDLFLLHLAIAYNNIINGLNIKFYMRNLLGREYSDPGYGIQDGIINSYKIPQNDRLFGVILEYKLNINP
ncbi:TonB-dependent receptor domain-containing protein [Aureibacter tunicatorum]|uniref:Outer membrane cobalamin receptor n=1 Tax=Aureibacter tunicatorum TaxID=866807 RepID=A0AAE3XRB5_9BACT|nr:TonB-dependent receptor [Aureibacter tunicatorum]MDR6241712.1 outer membrane cobalamin receptor [Aureibacter tunicatorum]BDD07303.1 hypothetical protein AUTU_47860 [Aureibacter tunicatorum]